jgi:hypothetical protein
MYIFGPYGYSFSKIVKSGNKITYILRTNSLSLQGDSRNQKFIQLNETLDVQWAKKRNGGARPVII